MQRIVRKSDLEKLLKEYLDRQGFTKSVKLLATHIFSSVELDGVARITSIMLENVSGLTSSTISTYRTKLRTAGLFSANRVGQCPVFHYRFNFNVLGEEKILALEEVGLGSDFEIVLVEIR
ncbi:hypothetical protein [Photobacterium leiognathi]|uniref:hypothetical protein n=1 Tax=Photobacterium leiognathi TaxID=553611 RepID=UPI0029826CF4|nr:hypothetical protein [Photobacterium leiognathi]